MSTVKWHEISPLRKKELQGIGFDEDSWNKSSSGIGFVRFGRMTNAIWIVLGFLFLAGALGAVSTLSGGVPSVQNDAGTGYWGQVTSSVDWCERNYTWSHYVAELFNTGTSFVLALAGALGIYVCRSLGPRVERRYQLLFWALFALGVGSVGFHATLKSEWQAP